MSIYEVIIKAAEHIQLNPEDFDFMPNAVPSVCGTPGCAAGWIGFYAKSGYTNTDEVCGQFLGIRDDANNNPLGHFLDRMGVTAWDHGYRNWQHSAGECSQVLRLYASKYHKPYGRSDSELVADLLRKLTTERIPEET